VWANIWDILVVLSPWLLFGACAAGLLHVVVPRSIIKTNFSGYRGVGKSVLLGVPLPLCSCAVIPAGVGLKKDGASDGATIAFLVSTPQTGVDSILVSASFLGWPFALFKVLSAAVTGLVAGGLAEWSSETVAPGAISEHEGDEVKDGFLAHVLDVLSSIWRWLLFGILVSAAINTAVPEEGMAILKDTPLWMSSFLALVIGLPLYVCATASVPIAASLVHAGLSPGAALVFLMAGPATNVATIGAVYRTLGVRNLVIYLGVIIVGSLGAGAIFDQLVAAPVPVLGGHHEHVTWWGQASAWILLSLLIGFAFRDLHGFWRRRGFIKDTSAVAVEFDVQGMTCNGCVRKLESRLGLLDGVEGVQVCLEPGGATVVGTLDPSVIVGAIREAGFQGALR
jgi:uncharacterized membrane protein YraQ (UPF0718 family)/copper chaperone CopZ